MLKKEIIPIESANRLKCGDCMHFKRQAKFEKVCNQMGVKHYSNAPSCFQADVWKLNEIDPHALHKLGVLLNQVDGSTLRVLMAVMKQQTPLTKRYSLKFGQPVYFRFGNDYLSNYFRGFVAGGTLSGDDYVFVSSTLEKTQRRQPLIAQLSRESVFTNSEFAKQKEKLIKADRIMDPKPLFAPTPDVIEDPKEYKPRSMETAPPEWYDKTDKKRPKFKKNVRTDKNGELTFVVNR